MMTDCTSPECLDPPRVDQDLVPGDKSNLQLTPGSRLNMGDDEKPTLTLVTDAKSNKSVVDATDADCMCCVPEQHRGKRWIKFLVENLLVILIVVAVVAGVGLGLGLRNVWTHEELTKIWYLGFPGRLLLNMLKMLILPLIVSSLITGMTSLSDSTEELRSSNTFLAKKSSTLGQLVRASVVYYITTTLIAVVLGIILVSSLRPGNFQDREEFDKETKSLKATPIHAILDLISNCFPDNLVSACFQRKRTVVGEKIFEYEETSKTTSSADINWNDNGNLTYMRSVKVDSPRLVTSPGSNILGIVVFSIALGIVLNSMKEEESRPMVDFFRSLNFATMMLVNVIIWFTPIGLVFLIAAKFVQTEDLTGIMANLGLYFITVLLGLFLHGGLVLPLLYFLWTRRNPFVFAANMSKALFTAWGTASSSATLPITMDCLVNKNHVNIDVVRFVAPVGATINMDGTALYEAVASVFIAQVNDIQLSLAQIIIVSLTATAAAIGAAGIPQAGLVTMVMVLSAVGLPEEDISLILAIDWLLDRFRTAVNVWGDSVGAGILDYLFRNSFTKVEVELKQSAIGEDSALEVQDPLLQSIHGTNRQSVAFNSGINLESSKDVNLKADWTSTSIA